MAKNVVLCSDGTGDQDIKNRGTNVFKLYEAVDIQGHKQRPEPGKQPLRQQVAFYDDGVGTANAFARVVGGAFGYGFSHNVKKLYRELVNVYEPGDQIFLFGFSRGAYTARALAGMIQHCGVLDLEYYCKKDRSVLNRKIHECWEDYSRVAFKFACAQKRRAKVPTPEEIAKAKEATVARRVANVAVEPYKPVEIAFIGVWDTVGAIGAPFDGLRELIGLIHPIWFANNTLGPDVRRACHALALDEEQRTFHPELWNEKDGRETRVKQVWFSGVHSNVGGGYPKQGMSLVALDWMMTEAAKEGLRFIDEDSEYVRLHQDVHDKLYDSRAGVAVYYRWSPRNLSQLCSEHKMGKPKMHISLFERIANGTFACNGTDTYSPGNIPFEFDVDCSGSIAWPEPAVPAQIQPLVQAHNDQKDVSLLDAKQKTIYLGKLSYYAFLLLTLTAIVQLFRGMGSMWCSGWTIPDRNALYLILWQTAAILVAAFLIHRWADGVDTTLCQYDTHFWHKCRRELRELLSRP